MRKKILLILTWLALSVFACGCKAGYAKSVKEHGLELIALMEEMVHTEKYMEHYTANERLMEMIKEMSDGDYSEPTAVYTISVSENSLLALSGMEEVDSVSEKLRETAKKRALGSLMAQVNARGGAERLAVSSICTLEKTFDSEELKEDVIYLYTYESALPAAVTFLRGEDHSVSATGVFIMDASFPSDSPEAVEQYFEEIQAEVSVSLSSN